MQTKLILALAAVAGVVFWALRRSAQRADEEAELWAQATDPID